MSLGPSLRSARLIPFPVRFGSTQYTVLSTQYLVLGNHHSPLTLSPHTSHHSPLTTHHSHLFSAITLWNNPSSPSSSRCRPRNSTPWLSARAKKARVIQPSGAATQS